MRSDRHAANAGWRAALSCALILSAASVGCGATGPSARSSTTIVQDVVVHIDPPNDRSPLEGPSARLSAAAKEVRELLGHRLDFELDAAIATDHASSLDHALTRAFEAIATELTRWKVQDPSAYDAARRKLSRMVVRYDPGARGPSRRFGEDGSVIITKTQKGGDLLPVGEALHLIQRDAQAEEARGFATMDPAAVPKEKRAGFVRWLTTGLGGGKSEVLARIGPAIRLDGLGLAPEHAEQLRRFLVDHVLRDLAYGQLESPTATDDVAAWLERSFDTFPEMWRARAVEILLGLGVKNARLAEPSMRLATRVVDAWAKAGHPLPSSGRPIAADFERVVCPHPKDERDNRSLAPRCDGGIVRLALTNDAATTQFGAWLATQNDPILVEHVFVSAGFSNYGGGEKKLVTLTRAVEGAPPLLRAALRTIAEEHAHGLTLELWLAEAKRLWAARPGARGTVLYLLAHLDPYGNRRIDFDEFARSVGGGASAVDAKAYLDLGYRAFSLSHIVWPAFAKDFSRANLLRPYLATFLDDPRVRHFRVQDPHAALSQLRHRLCDEEADDDLRALFVTLTENSKAKPGRALDDVTRSFDPKTCDPPCAETREGTCIRRMRPDEVARRRRGRGL